MLWFLDMACVVMSYLVATFLRYYTKRDWGDKTLHYMVCLVFLLFCSVHSILFDRNSNFMVRGYLKEFVSVCRSVAFMVIGTLLVVFFLRWASILSRIVVGNFIWIVILLTWTVRILFKKFLKKHILSDKNVIKVVAVSEKELMESTINHIMDKGENLGYKVVRAYCSDADTPYYVRDVHVHRGVDNITSRLITDPFDEVLINAPHMPRQVLQEMILGFNEMGIVTHYCLEDPGEGLNNTSLGNFMGYSVLTYCVNTVNYKHLFIKRAFDILGGIVGLIFTGILTIFLGPAIKLDSPGPIFFSQTRVGKNGRRFKMYKFRSMYIDAEARKKELEAQNQMKGLMFKMENDPRVTKVGAFIRKTSLDEFPQFLNVLKGDMSLVGTRPPTEAEFEQYNEHYRRRLSMTPGLTGLWQISGRSDIEDFDEVVKLDLKYIDNWSLSEDIKIILQTIGVVLFGKGAR